MRVVSGKVGQRQLEILSHARMSMAVGGGDPLLISLSRFVNPAQSLQSLSQFSICVTLIVGIIQISLQFDGCFLEPFKFQQFIGQAKPHSCIVRIGFQHLPENIYSCLLHQILLNLNENAVEGGDDMHQDGERQTVTPATRLAILTRA